MQTKFTKWLSMLLVVCMLCSLALPTLAANDYTAKLSSNTMTEDGSITVTFSSEATGYDGIYYDVQVIENGNWTSPYFAEAWVTSGTTYTISGDNLGVTFSASNTYQIYIGYWENGSWKSDALSTTTITVTNGSSDTHDYTLSIALDDDKLGTDPVYPYVYDSTNTTVNVTVTVTEDGEAVTSLASNYDIYIWIDYPAGGKDDVAITGSSLGSDGTITGAIDLTDIATFSDGFTTGVDYNVYARVNYDSAEVDGSMVGTSFTINTTYSMELALDEDKYDSANDYYVYDFNDTINAAASFILTIDGIPKTAVTTVPTGTKLTIWYGYGVDSDGDGVLDSWADILFDSGSYITTSAGSGNTGTITVSPGNFEAGTVYKVYAGLYNEGGEQLAYAEVPFIVKQASFYTRTLTLDGDIGVNYYVDMTGVDENDMANYTVVFSGTGINQTATFNSGSYRDDFNGETKYYRFTVTVDSTQMATEFTAELQYGGTTIQTDTYSVESYCKWAIENNKAEQAICAALLNYGGYSQTYFESTGTKANANLSTYFSTAGGTWTDPVASAFTADLSSYEVEISDDMPSEITANSFSASLVLESQTVIRIYFNANSIEGLTVKVGEETLNIQTATNSSYGYYVEYEVQASKLGTAIVFTITNASGTTGTVSYSAYAYINTNKDSSTANLANVCKALYYYGEAAIAYNNWYTGNT